MPSPIGHPPYNVNGEGGRPKRYTDEYIDFLANELNNWIQIPENIFIENFCLKHDIPEQKVTETLNKNLRFSEAYNKLKTKQKVKLFEGSLNKTFAHPMCALLLSHNHSIIPKTEQKIIGSIDSSLAALIEKHDGSSKDIVNDPNT